MRIVSFFVLLVGSLVACRESSVGPPPPPPPPLPPAPELGCASTADVQLTVGQSTALSIGDGAQCLRLPGTDAQPAEYLVVALSGAATQTVAGVTADFRLMSRSAGSPTAAAAAMAATAGRPLDPVAEFHARLRSREARVASRFRALPPRAAIATAPPTVGDLRTFTVCAGLPCDSFVGALGRAGYVGRSVAIFVDDAAPSDGFTDLEIGRLGQLFDQWLYPGDTTAFGRPSDVDGNGLVFAFLSKAVNRLTWPCLGGIITGYFVGSDLLTSEAGSNGAEVVYLAVPDPNGEAGCRVTKDFATRLVAPTMTHELQHLISFNQHVVTRSGDVEQTWLNEGLSHLAEELAGRVVPNEWCYLNDCVSQFSVPTLTNAYHYLIAPEANFLVYPRASTGSLAERGAAWLFLRWIMDHFGGGEPLTRRLVQTSLTGAANLSAAVGQSFASMVGEWHLANWLDHLPGFTPVSDRLRYTTWNFRSTFASFRAQLPSQYPRVFPLVPDSAGAAYDALGVLRGGSAHYTRVVLEPHGPPRDLRLSGPAGALLAQEIGAMVAVARVR